MLKTHLRQQKVFEKRKTNTAHYSKYLLALGRYIDLSLKWCIVVTSCFSPWRKYMSFSSKDLEGRISSY